MNDVAQTTTIFRGDSSRLKNVVNLLEKLQPDYFAREIEKIFRRAWLPLVAASEVPRKSDYVVVEVPTLKASLLVVRGDEVVAIPGVLQAAGITATREGE